MDEVRIHETPYIYPFFPQRKALIVAGTGEEVWPEAEAGTGETKADAVVKTGVGKIEIFGEDFESAGLLRRPREKLPKPPHCREHRMCRARPGSRANSRSAKGVDIPRRWK